MQFVPYRHKVQYYETDTMKIVHHSNYVRWMEEARVDMLEQMGIGYDVMEQEGILSPVLSVSCTYKAMTRFPETVEISVRLVRYTGVKFDLAYEIRGAKEHDLRSFGESAHCFIDQSGKPLSLKKKFPAWDEIFRSHTQAP